MELPSPRYAAGVGTLRDETIFQAEFARMGLQSQSGKMESEHVLVVRDRLDGGLDIWDRCNEDVERTGFRRLRLSSHTSEYPWKS